MKQTMRLALALVLMASALVFWAPAVPGQKATQQETLLQRAIQKETVDGDLAAAIKLYKEIVANPGGNRALAARALLHLGQCNEKLGSAEARQAYEQLVREYADQAELAAEARARLTALAGRAAAANGPTRIDRRVWAGPDVGADGHVSADGRFLSFTDWNTGDLAVHDLVTGTNRHVTNKGTWTTSDECADISLVSPDSKQIVHNWYNKDGFYDLRIVGVDGSNSRVVYTDRQHVTYITPMAWSPDGKYVLAGFMKTDETNELVLVSVASGSTRILRSTGKEGTARAVFSPDGRYLAYATKGTISLFDLEAGREFPLFQDAANHAVLGWAPDGRHILFQSDRAGSVDAWLITVVNGKAEGGPVLVKQNFNLDLGFTRSGAFYYAVAQGIRDVQIAELDPASGKLVSLPQPASRRWAGITDSPAWSADGNFLAYIRRGTATQPSTIIIRSTATGEERELKAGMQRLGFSLRWTPDGRGIVASGFERANRWALVRVDVQTGQTTSLMPLAIHEGMVPRFDVSPDGKTIFHVETSLTDPNANAVTAHDIESGHETTLLRQKGLYYVSVSPDGRRLAVTSSRTDDRIQQVLILPVSGGDPRAIASIDGEEANGRVEPVWTPDGRYVLFAKGQRGRATRNVQVWRVPAEGGQPERLELTVDQLWWLRLHPDGRHVAFGASQTKLEVWVMENFLPAVKKGT